MPEIMPRNLFLTEFQALVGQDLLADCDPEPVALRLVEATPLRSGSADERAPFILVFRSGPEQLLVDGAYTMRNGTFDPASIFLSSMTPPRDAEAGYYYQAIFN
ncbi:MAG TPA: hypothetical protein VHG29_09660 [Novosphingobium sp.]|nr:hypothetical protein [Novosphingobium sp.]